MRPWTLRTRLVATIVALLAAAAVVIGAVSVVALRSILVERVDEDLRGSVQQVQHLVDGPPAGPGQFFTPGQPLETLLAVREDDRIQANLLAVADRPSVSGAGALAALADVPADGLPHTVALGDLGEYRITVAASSGQTDILVGLPLSGVQQTTSQLTLVVVLVALLGVLAAGAAASVSVRLALRPLDRVAATASHVAGLPLDRGDVSLAVRVPEQDTDERTEVGRVGAAFNRMLGHVSRSLQAREASERKVRTFVADASHELRTPLASIRGYSELTRRSGHELPPDIVHALGRIESESTRMTSLVEDLLLLARLDEGRELARDPVDLSALAADALSDAAAAGPDHEWLLSIPDSPVVVPGDAARLHQVLANLLANARVHTPAGTTVTCSVSLSGPSAVLSVADDGPGIDPAVRDTVFERFVRGDSSRSRSAGSTGLGLAIVQAVVAAHGGTVTVDSGPSGTVFRVTLPQG